MTKLNSKSFPCGRLVLVTALSALAVTGCKHMEEPGTRVAGWTLIDPAQRHPILVSEQPTHLPIRVARGSSRSKERRTASSSAPRGLRT